ncbi:hypothetical protein N7G274_010330 [Stereocaulon virgatum]|uniref:Uncharacterized protein n=1 Tax=Stereocaulon virgatum TaxID=373712 RepID=A0ABR3ZTQ4_9LECA
MTLVISIFLNYLRNPDNYSEVSTRCAISRKTIGADATTHRERSPGLPLSEAYQNGPLLTERILPVLFRILGEMHASSFQRDREIFCAKSAAIWIFRLPVIHGMGSSGAHFGVG